jgi:alpha-L-rhamnosidase
MTKVKSILCTAVILLIAMRPGFAQDRILPPTGLLCDLLSADAGVKSVLIFNKKPAFSWEQPVSSNGSVQSAYQILMSDEPAQLAKNIGNVWDPGKVLGNQSTGILFNGIALKPNTHYYWKIRVWSGASEPGQYSNVAAFLTGEELSDYKNPAYPLQISEQRPISLKMSNNIYLADFGKDAFGQLKIQLYSKTGGDSVEVHLGEILDGSGRINRKPPGKIRYARYFLPLQKGTHIYKLNINKDPYNTRSAAIKMPDYIGEVTPFRYCEIENYTGLLKMDDLDRLAVNYRFDEAASFFHSSDPTLNAIWDLCKYSIKATSFLGIYVDGDRERIPYEADAYINQLSHYAVDKEFTMARNSHEYLITNPTWPTEWNLQSVLMAWNDYLYTGDLRSVAHYYKDLQAKTLISLSDSTGLISTLNGKLTDEVKASIHVTGKLQDIVDWPLKTETDGFVFTKYNAVVNAFHYKSLVVMQKLAADLGKKEDAEMYKKLAIKVKNAFVKVFFDQKRNIFVDGLGTDHASLHANAFALALGLVDLKYQNSVLTFIKSRGMACSVYGSQFLLDGIYDANDAAYGLSLLTSKTDRSWFNMIRVGSTITLEAWDNKYKPNQDWNHAWGAAPANVISRKLMGIEPIAPGWSVIRIKPQIADLENASMTVPTIKGQVKAVYTQQANWFNMEIDIPANTRAQVHLPLKNEKKYVVVLDGKPIKTAKVGQTALVPNLGSGRHILRIGYTY